MTKFLLVGDLHIGKMATVMGEEKALKEQIHSLRRQIRVAQEKSVTHGILLGDVFDTPFPLQTHLIAMIDVLSKSRMQWLVYPGNHDMADKQDISLKLLSALPDAGALTNVKFVTEQSTVKFGGLRAHVMPWSKTYKKIDRSADVVLFHDSLVGARSDSGREVGDNEGLSRSVFRGAKAFFSGHLHTPQPHYAGTAAQMSFGEKPEKRLLFLEFSRGEVRTKSIGFEPQWRLAKVSYDPDDPPHCDAPDTYYSLNVARGSPGPRWMLEHPQVVKFEGQNKKQEKLLAEKVIDLAASSASTESDSVLLRRWLKAYSALDKEQRKIAEREDSRLGSLN